MRLFVAVDLDPAVVERLGALQREWAERVEHHPIHIRWVAPSSIHLTLQFLGDTDEAQLPAIDEALAEGVQPFAPFELTCRGLGAFPGPERPRVLWAGVDPKAARALGAIQGALEAALEPLGFEPEGRPFSAHVTLGRVKSRRTADLTEPMKELAGFDGGRSAIEAVLLYESVLTPEGPKYDVRGRYPLG